MAQYDFKKVQKENKLRLTWHGEPTRIVLVKNEPKVDVATGETVEVSEAVAKHLLSYSSLWTLQGDKPVVHPYMNAYKKAVESRDAKTKAVARKAEKKAGKKAASAKDEPEKEPELEPITEADVDLMETPKEVLAALKARGHKANKNASLEELKALLKEKLVEVELVDHELTQEDLDNNPDLVAEGAKVGDITKLPKEATE